MNEDTIELIPVEGHNALGRDPQSNAILNTDMSGYCLLYTSDAADE